jgi:hypothetical protein
MIRILLFIAWLILSTIVSGQTSYQDDMEKAIELFATFKPETEFHPNWGLEKAKTLAQQCENKRN